MAQDVRIVSRQPMVSSPFDVIRHVDKEGEHWFSREMQPYLGYVRYENVEKILEKSKSACRNVGCVVSDHFRDITKLIAIGKGGQRPVADVRMTRRGAYWLAMNGDPDKPEVAAAQAYFVVATEWAEKNHQVSGSGQPSFAGRPWSQRFVETIQPHARAVYEIERDGFTVLTALSAYILGLEDELFRHMFDPQPSDRPDGSIGQCWAFDRKERGLAPSIRVAPLYLPDRDRTVQVSVYDNSERGYFERWYREFYLPEKLPAYLHRKPEFGRLHPLSAASVADHACLKVTGRSAILKPPIRNQLNRVGNFFPVGAELPQLAGSGQRMLWDV